jgi:hypothetical protein
MTLTPVLCLLKGNSNFIESGHLERFRQACEERGLDIANYPHCTVRSVWASSFIDRCPFPLQVFGLTQSPRFGDGISSAHSQHPDAYPLGTLLFETLREREQL